jgi:hypothetical protein
MIIDNFTDARMFQHMQINKCDIQENETKTISPSQRMQKRYLVKFNILHDKNYEQTRHTRSIPEYKICHT